MNKKQFVTVGDDSTLRLWDIPSRKQIKVLSFNINETNPQFKDSSGQDKVKARSVAISPDEKYFAVGFKDGSLAIIDIEKWTIKYKDIECKAYISDVKFSPNGNLLAIGSHDTLIQVYEFPTMIKKVTLSGHSSYIRHLDWSMDSKILQSNSGNQEILFWDVEAGNSVSAASYRNEVWGACTFGWSVQGICPLSSKETEINSCDRSSKYEPYQLLAVGDNKGRVRVFRYPCVMKAGCKEGKGHGGEVVNVKFGGDDKYVLSVGGSDNSIFQWTIT